MKRRITDISKSIKFDKLKNDKRIVVFLICVLIATGLWFLNALSKDYLTTITYPVKYVNSPSNTFLANQPPSQIEIKVEAHGFTLLRNNLNLSFSPIIMNLKTLTKDEKHEDGLYILESPDFLHQIRNQISNEISIIEVHPNSIKIFLDSLKTKSVPVKSDVSIGFSGQYNLKRPVLIIPSSVSISGPATIIDSIKYITTEQKNFNKLNKSTSKTLEIIHPENTTVKPDKIQAKIDIEEYTEKELRVPIVVKNKPDIVNLKLFPSEVRVTCLVGLSRCEELSESDFNVFVDYKEIQSKANKLKVIAEKKSSFVQVVKTNPKTIEYLIETN